MVLFWVYGSLCVTGLLCYISPCVSCRCLGLLFQEVVFELRFECLQTLDGFEFCGDGVPGSGVSFCCVVHGVCCWCFDSVLSV